MVHRSRSLVCRRPVRSPRARVICIPYAGGSASLFHAWPDHFPDDIELGSVQLPGRQDRLHEAPLQSVAAMVDEIAQALESLAPAPLVLYGHSLGALLAFELAMLPVSALARLSAIIVGARRAPHLPSRVPAIAHLPDPEFKQGLYRFYGTALSILQNADLMELSLPALRADFTAHERHPPAPDPVLAGPCLKVPVTVLHGRDDASVPRSDAQAWAALTSGPVALHEVAAGHLFLDTHRAWTLERVREVVSAL